MSPAFLSGWLWVPLLWAVLFCIVWAKPQHRFGKMDAVASALVLSSLLLARYLP